MKTLYDLGVEIAKIREAINAIEVKGEKNASLVVFAHRKCSDIIDVINAVSRLPNPDQNGEDPVEKEDEMNGQPD